MAQILSSENANEEAIRAWDGPLFDRFLRFQDIVIEGFAPFSEEALHMLAPRPGDRVLDIGCGFGDTTQRIAGLLGPEGEALGIDAAPRFIALAREDAQRHSVTNARFIADDVQSAALPGNFDLAFSRFGTMFFANPVIALGNVRRALEPGGRLVMIVWRRRLDNDWLYRAQQIVEGIVKRPEEYDEPTCGPGPFSMADADTVSDILLGAGFDEIELRRLDVPLLIGADLPAAIDLVTALGPAGEILRLAGDRAAHLHGQVQDALEAGLAEFSTAAGVRAPASVWIVSARAPEPD